MGDLKEQIMISSTQNVQAYQTGRAEHSSKAKELEAIQERHKESKAAQFAQIMSEVQSFVKGKALESSFEVRHQEFQDFLSDIGYGGKPIASLSQEEASTLVGEDGFFGVQQTSERIAGFVISGASGDEERLREGKKGIVQGFKDAEQMWGEKLPDIAYETIDKAVAMIDKALIEGGFSVLDETV